MAPSGDARRRWLFILPLLVATPACAARVVGYDGPSTDATIPSYDSLAGPFEGTWDGTGDTATTYTVSGSDAGEMSALGSTTMHVVIVSTTPHSMSITLSTPGGPGSCTFVADRTGSTATLPSGQLCEQLGTGQNWSYTLESGSASVNGNMLELSFVLAGSATSGTTTVHVRQSMTIHATSS